MASKLKTGTGAGAVAGGLIGGPVGAGIGAIGGGILGGIADIWGGNEAADAQKAAQNAARNDLNTGYTTATGFQQPIYDTGINNYTGLSDKYAAGGFNLNPEDVFKDPSYQAQMRSGVAAINSGAEGRGNLFSTGNQRALTGFGQDLFANREDALQNRLNTRFQQGMQLSQPGFGAANNLSNLATEHYADLANNDLGSGSIRAGNIQNTTGAITGFLGDVSGGNDYQNYLASLKKKGGGAGVAGDPNSLGTGLS